MSAKRECAVDGCEKPFRAKGMCATHYSRMERGIPLDSPMRKFGTVEERFWPKVRKSDGCWEWMARKNPQGYGILKREGGSRLAHRISYELAHGGLPQDMDIDHICRNTSCVRPGHLRATTRAENVQNRSGATRLSKSGIRGVRLLGNRWQARAQMSGKGYHIGYFSTKEEAESAISEWRRDRMPFSEMDKEKQDVA